MPVIMLLAMPDTAYWQLLRSLLMEVEQDDTDQHENTTKECVEQELPG